MKDLKGKTVFITGATSGIGKSAAYKFAELGANLILAARRTDRLEVISSDMMSEFSVKVFTIEMDVQRRISKRIKQDSRRLCKGLE